MPLPSAPTDKHTLPLSKTPPRPPTPAPDPPLPPPPHPVVPPRPATPPPPPRGHGRPPHPPPPRAISAPSVDPAAHPRSAQSFLPPDGGATRSVRPREDKAPPVTPVPNPPGR